MTFDDLRKEESEKESVKSDKSIFFFSWDGNRETKWKERESWRM